MADVAFTSPIEQSVAPLSTTTIPPSDTAKPASNRLLGRYKSLQLVRKPSKIKTGETAIGVIDPIESAGNRTSKDDFHLLRLKQWPPPAPSSSASANASTQHQHSSHGSDRGSYTAPSSPTTSHHHQQQQLHQQTQHHNSRSVSPTPHPTPSPSITINANPAPNPNPTLPSMNPSTIPHLTPSNSLTSSMSLALHPTTPNIDSSSASAPYVLNCLEDLLQHTSSQQHQILSLIHSLDPHASIPVRSCLPSSSHLCFLHNRVLDLRHLVDMLTVDLHNLKNKNSQLQKQLNAYSSTPGSSNVIKKAADHHLHPSLSRQSSLNFDLPPHLAAVVPSTAASSSMETPNTSSSSS